jgi:hypothetical protein
LAGILRSAAAKTSASASTQIVPKVVLLVIQIFQFPSVALRPGLCEHTFYVQEICQTVSPQALPFPYLADTAKPACCINAGHCASEEHIGREK